ncbi:MAG: type II/IV secretion system ATPase subunit [Thermocladium sp.]
MLWRNHGSSLGAIVESTTIKCCGLETNISVRAVGSTYLIQLSDDDVPDIDIYELHKKALRGKGIEKAAKSLKIEATPRLLGAYERWSKHYGALTPLLLYSKLTDIYINNVVMARHSDYGLVEVNIEVPERDINYLLRRISSRCRTPITSYQPMISVTDEEYGIRISVTIPPVGGPAIHIRIMPRKPWTLPYLVNNGMVTARDAAILWQLFEDKVPLLIVGPIGSGKTSLANAIAFMGNPSLLMALIMDVDEMNLPNHLVYKLMERRSFGLGVKSISKDDLISQALRMGVDHIIVNEVITGAEAKAWLNAVTSGHGGITTFHAGNAIDAAKRFSIIAPDIGNALKHIAIIETSIIDAVDKSGDISINRRLRVVRSIIHDNDLDDGKIAAKAEIIRGLVGYDENSIIRTVRNYYSNPTELMSDAK